MNLRRVAAKFETTKFDTFDESNQTWTTGALLGKVMPVDRFLSIFHRPTTRRQLGIAPDYIIPPSNTIRAPDTGEVFIVGVLRSDIDHSKAYDSVGILSSCPALATIRRKEVVGSGETLGHLVDSIKGVHYSNIELRTMSEADGTVDAYEASSYLTFPIHSDILEDDYVDFQSKVYWIQGVYIDSGLKVCRAVERDDQRVDFLINRMGAGSGFNPSTGVVTAGRVDHQVSGIALTSSQSEPTLADNSLSEIEFIIRFSDIGFKPSKTDKLTYESKVYDVYSVMVDKLKLQYRVKVKL